MYSHGLCAPPGQYPYFSQSKQTIGGLSFFISIETYTFSIARDHHENTRGSEKHRAGQPLFKGESTSLKGSGDSLEQNSFLNGGNDRSCPEDGCRTAMVTAHSTTFRRGGSCCRRIARYHTTIPVTLTTLQEPTRFCWQYSMLFNYSVFDELFNVIKFTSPIETHALTLANGRL